MKYVGLQEQITSNNRKSIFLLIGFPGVLLGAVYAVLMFASYNETGGGVDTHMANDMFIDTKSPLVFSLSFFRSWKSYEIGTGKPSFATVTLPGNFMWTSCGELLPYFVPGTVLTHLPLNSSS